MKALLESILNGQTLSEVAAHNLVTTLAAGQVDPVIAGAILASMRLRGETIEEIRGAAEAMLDLSIPPDLPHSNRLVDTCGTGGDGSDSLNLSTGVSLLAAAAGATVVKHGNRSISSQSGSADVLAALPLDLKSTPCDLLADTGFAFLFAPKFHPAMANIMPVRRALGTRTLFNILGPLCNPARPAFQVVGAYALDVAEKMAHALSGLPHTQRAFVIHGANGWDEATPICPFTLFEVQQGRVQRRVIDPQDLGVRPCKAEDLRGGDARYNAMRLRRVLEGREMGHHRDALVLGTGLALEVCGLADTLTDGMLQASHTLNSGAGAELLHAIGPAQREVVNG